MKKLLLLTLILTFTIFASCDGKDRARLTLEEKITNKELPVSFFEKTEYFPKEYTEVETDTSPKAKLSKFPPETSSSDAIEFVIAVASNTASSLSSTVIVTLPLV